jgi:hypothetical protein
MSDTPGPSWAGNTTVPGRWASSASQWMNGVGPVAVGVAALVVITRLTLSWTGQIWPGLLKWLTACGAADTSHSRWAWRVASAGNGELTCQRTRRAHSEQVAIGLGCRVRRTADSFAPW